MTPCEEVKTIHASQGDNATRKWAFDLYDENGKIDSSDIKEQMIFDSRVGGTEQILPENTSDPTTSPIIADIQYPDSLRSEQAFLYRESPTTEDGQAKITHIKGNTLVWNQLLAYISTSHYLNYVSIADGEAKLNFSGQASAGSTRFIPDAQYRPQAINGRVYFEIIDIKLTNSNSDYRVGLAFGTGTPSYLDPDKTIINSYQRLSGLFTASSNSTIMLTIRDRSGTTGLYDAYVKNWMIFDLTAMGLDTLSLAEVQQWFSNCYPLPYYDYTIGKLLPFKGESLKTTGKNLFDKSNASMQSNGYIDYVNGVYGTSDNTISVVVPCLPNTVYTISKISSARFRVGYSEVYPASLTPIYGAVVGETGTNLSITTGNGAKYLVATVYSSSIDTVSSQTIIDSVQVELGSSASSYEPYTSSTINLPTLTYFPTGMKSAGSVYDEITESKADTRVGTVDLGTLVWSYNTSLSIFWTQPDSRFIANDNYECAKYEFVGVKNDSQMASAPDKTIGIGTGLNIKVKDSAYTDASSFAQAMSGVLLYHELKTPTEESITTASLVTEKGEAPLYYDDELIADCNETISSEGGIFDAKIKLMDDETVYSQKIQLHVERKP